MCLCVWARASGNSFFLYVCVCVFEDAVVVLCAVAVLMSTLNKSAGVKAMSVVMNEQTPRHSPSL